MLRSADELAEAGPQRGEQGQDVAVLAGGKVELDGVVPRRPVGGSAMGIPPVEAGSSLDVFVWNAAAL
jgi:hypothetical protein